MLNKNVNDKRILACESVDSPVQSSVGGVRHVRCDNRSCWPSHHSLSCRRNQLCIGCNSWVTRTCPARQKWQENDQFLISMLWVNAMRAELYLYWHWGESSISVVWARIKLGVHTSSKRMFPLLYFRLSTQPMSPRYSTRPYWSDAVHSRRGVWTSSKWHANQFWFKKQKCWHTKLKV